jgi:hypothetical protein
MSVTPVGYVIIPVSVATFIGAPRYLLSLGIALSVLQAASVFNIEGDFAVGISPYFFVAILICLRFVPLWLSGRIGFAPREQVLLYQRPLLLLVLWALASVIVLPAVFAGVRVDAARAGMDAYAPSPLHWSLSNGAQIAYLMLNCVFVTCLVYESANRLQVDRFFAAFRWSGALAAAVGLYQLVAHIYGLPYPDNFFNSNSAWAQLTDQRLAGSWRVSATFTEPSAAGSYFAMWTALVLFSAVGDEYSPRSYWCLPPLGIVMLAVTTSTTGYVAGAALLLLFFKKQLPGLVLHRTISRRGLFAIVVILAALVAGALLLPNFSHVIRAVIWQKSQLTSGQNRMATSVHAYYIAVQSLGLGVGLGSNRPSGLLSYVVSNLGIPGLVLFLYLLQVTRALSAAAVTSAKAAEDIRLLTLIRASGCAFAVEMFAMVVAGAELTSPGLWVSWAVLLGTCRQASLSSQELANSDSPSASQFS